MKHQIKKYVRLPFEEGKKYKTKFQTGDVFLLTKINHNAKGEIIGFEGIYENSKHLGICPLGADRLVQEKIIVDAEMEISLIVWEKEIDVVVSIDDYTKIQAVSVPIIHGKKRPK